MNSDNRSKNFMIMAAVAVLFVACIPLFSVNCIQGHDLSYHLLRIEALKEGILAGRPFLKVNLLYFGGRGYASSLFYPDLLLYFPALLRCVHVPIGYCYHIFVALCIILSFFSMYLSVRGIVSRSCGSDTLKADMTGLIAAVCYTLAQYHLDDIYTRAAVGEFTAMIFIPVLLYGIYDMLLGGMKRPALMAAGFAGLLLCHTTTTVFMAALYAVVFIYAVIYRCIRGRMRAGWLFRIAGAAVGALVITAFYWVPVLEQFSVADFNTDSAGFDLEYERLMLRDIFVNKNPSMGPALPLLCLLLFLVSYMFATEKKLRYLGCVMSLAAFVFTICSTGLLPWRQLQGVLGFVQFPWRLFVLATPLYCGAIALFICSLPLYSDDNKGVALLLVMAVMILSGLMNLGRIDEGYYSYSDDYYSYVPFTGSVIGGEWLPASVQDREKLIRDTDAARASYGGVITVERQGGELYLDMPVSARYVDVPLIYYKGYRAVGPDGVHLAMGGDGENGDMRIYLPPEGRIKVYYAGTMAQYVSAGVSLIFLAAAPFIVGRRRRRRRD